MKDYRATFDLSDADWKAIDKALSLLEEKFMALRDITDEDRAWQVPFSTRAEAFCRKAVDVMVKDRDVLIDTDVDLDEIRGDLLSIDELRPRISRLESLLDAVRRVYASTLSETALRYRQRRGLLFAHALLLGHRVGRHPHRILDRGVVVGQPTKQR